MVALAPAGIAAVDSSVVDPGGSVKSLAAEGHRTYARERGPGGASVGRADVERQRRPATAPARADGVGDTTRGALPGSPARSETAASRGRRADARRRGHPSRRARASRRRGGDRPASGRGRPLDARRRRARSAARSATRLSDVRVHTDDHAAALIQRRLGARLHGRARRLLRRRRVQARTQPDGRELLTHELTHVVQQRGAPQSGPLQVSQPGDALEREADAAAASRLSDP